MISKPILIQIYSGGDSVGLEVISKPILIQIYSGGDRVGLAVIPQPICNTDSQIPHTGARSLRVSRLLVKKNLKHWRQRLQAAQLTLAHHGAT